MAILDARRAPDDFAEWRLVVTLRARDATRLEELRLEPPPDPSIDQLLLAARTAPIADRDLWLTGGEPTLRADLPQLLRALTDRGSSPALRSDGLGLASDTALGPLIDAGLGRLRVFLHSTRPDAHDWLVRRSGAARRVVRTIRRAGALGIATEIEATLTRPTAPYLFELVEVAASLGVSVVHLVRPVGRGPVLEDFVALSPRLALLDTHLERATAAATRHGVSLWLHGLPECVSRRMRHARVLPRSVHWLVAEGAAWRAALEQFGEPAHVSGCPRCPGLPVCAGAPLDYVGRFGQTEFRSEQTDVEPDGASAADPASPASIEPPPPRQGRAPATRARAVRALAGRPLGGDPLLFVSRAPVPDVLRFRFGAPSRVACDACGDVDLGEEVEPTRRVRLRLVRAAQEGARVLRVASAGSLAHPDVAALLRETTLLSFQRVEVAGEASSLDELSDAELYLLRGIDRLDVALFGPDASAHDAHVGRDGAFAATLRGAARFATLTGAAVGSFAVLHDATPVAGFARAWEAGELPGDPTFRLSPRGGSLDALAGAATALPAGTARRALEAVLPACLGASEADSPDPGQLFDEAWRPGAPPSGCDRHGMFGPCVCDGAARPCRGTALGWNMQRPT